MIFAGGGDDLISGRGGHDLICAGPGNDVVDGGPGSDRIQGGSGDDHLAGADGGDRIDGGPGGDRIGAQRGNDRLDGGPGDGDVVDGGLGDDHVSGGPGARDEAIGGLGVDFVNGGPGDGDVARGDYGWDVIAGGPGRHDVASFASTPAGPRGHGVSASLAAGRASGDGRDRIRSDIEDLEGSPFDDTLIGGRGANVIDGGPGTDHCVGWRHRQSCGRDPLRGAVVAQMDPSPAGGGGLAVRAAARRDRIRIDYSPTQGFTVRARSGVAPGPGCAAAADPKAVLCTVEGRVRHVIVDLGRGDDQLRLGDGLALAGTVRVSAGPGDDLVEGGPGDELIESFSGADRLLGGGGSDGLIGGPGGPDALVGNSGSDVLAAGQACGGGRLIGGPGRDNASFAETPAHPSVLYASLARGVAYIVGLRHCRRTRISSSEDLEGSFDWDILIGDRRGNGIFGQPGRDRLYGRGGDDAINARDGEADFLIDCGGGRDTLLGDSNDPPGRSC